jgi:hypothetical protein
MRSRLTVVSKATVSREASAAANMVYDAQAIVKVVAALLEGEDHGVSEHMLMRALNSADRILEQAGCMAAEVGMPD